MKRWLDAAADAAGLVPEPALTSTETTMLKRTIWAATLGVAALAAAAPVMAQSSPDLGRREYEANCAICHGAAGKGDGYYGKLLSIKVPDLTTYARRNGGVFSVDRLYTLIDGREVPPGHGTRQMPIWGIDYTLQSAEKYRNFPTHDPEVLVRVRILALIDHIYSLQSK